MKLSDLQIALVANRAGFTGSDLPIAVAVALAESGGDTNAINHANSNGTQDFGLFQINSIHHDLLSTGQWSNPADNARMAFSVWHGQNWQGWSTYNNGKYLLYMARGRAAASALTKSGGAGNVALPFDGPKHSGPYAVRMNSGKTEWAAAHDLRVGGKWYTAVDYSPLTTNPDVNNLYPRAGTVPIGAVTVMAKFIQKTLPHDDAAQNAATVWLEPGGHSKPNSAGNVLLAYCDYIYPLSSTKNPDGGLPGQIGNKVINSADAIKNFFAFITNPHNWVRLAYFVIGGMLVLFAAYKVSGGSGMPVTPLGVVKAVHKSAHGSFQQGAAT